MIALLMAPMGDAGYPVRLDVSFAESLVDPGLIGPKRPPALEHESDAITPFRLPVALLMMLIIDPFGCDVHDQLPRQRANNGSRPMTPS